MNGIREYSCGHITPGEDGEVYYDYACTYCRHEGWGKTKADKNAVIEAIKNGNIIGCSLFRK